MIVQDDMDIFLSKVKAQPFINHREEKTAYFTALEDAALLSKIVRAQRDALKIIKSASSVYSATIAKRVLEETNIMVANARLSKNCN